MRVKKGMWDGKWLKVVINMRLWIENGMAVVLLNVRIVYLIVNKNQYSKKKKDKNIPAPFIVVGSYHGGSFVRTFTLWLDDVPWRNKDSVCGSKSWQSYNKTAETPG
jgi:hypothetical protein